MPTKHEIVSIKKSDGSDFSKEEEEKVIFINTWAKEIYAANVEKGFWDKRTNMNPLEVAGMLMLMVSELAEAMEAHRKDLPDDKLPNRKGLEVELADTFIRILDLAAGLHMDLGGAIVEKLEYNTFRAFMHGDKLF